MNIIPVIDLKDGLVVSAQKGQRDTYLPIQSRLCASSSIEDVLKGYLSIYAFNIIYIADLNAITNSGDNQNLIDSIIMKNQSIKFWIDNGTKTGDLSNSNADNYKPVIGSEYQSVAPASKIMPNCILSLDFFPEQGYKGSKGLIENPVFWPQNIIIMTLDRVGNNRGPDIEKLKYFRKKFPNKTFIAAGGVQNEVDLENLQKIGINHALIATALHSGKLTTKSIIKWQAKKCPEQTRHYSNK